MKTKLLSLLLLIVCFSVFGKPVDENRAKTVGLYFLQNKTNSTLLKEAKNLQLAYKVTATIGDALEERTMFYVFNVDTIGFVIVSGDDTVIPILGYSDQGIFNPNNMSPAFQKWLEGYKNEIIYVISHDIKATEDINKQWSLQITNKNSNSTFSTNAVAPLIQTHWDQQPYYNALCPFDNNSSQRTVTGCPATAMAQIMKFWNYPATGVGFHSYNHPQYGTLSANFGNTPYQWSSMPNQLNSSSTSEQINAVATLMYHCGVAVEMNYGVAATGGSSSYVINSYSPSVNQTCENAFKTYFGYNASTLQGVQRVNYTDSNWINLLKNELDLGRPIQYAGFGSGGHSWVCDGYDINNYFHMNWGWGNFYPSNNQDGNFTLNALNPSILGTGGGSGGFNSNQQALIGIQPPASAQIYNLKLYNFVTPSATTINYGQAFSVSTNIANYGTNSFSGDYTIGAFDSNGNFIDYVETKTGYNLQSGNAYQNDLVFSTTGMFTLLPGTYYLGLYYRPTGGGWKIVQNNTVGSSNYTNFPQITVVNPNPIALNSVMTVSPGTTLTQGQGASVNLNIVNNGSSTFTGQYNVSLYTLDGTFVQTIGALNEVNGLPAGYTYSSPYLTFTTTAITATPGSYLIALEHLPTNGSWTLTGSTSNFINPIRVTVVQAPYQADIYEVNDVFNQSYSLPLSFTSNTASVKTTGSNAHVGTDNDYYKIVLPSGYDYTITPRLQDSYSSNNGNTYTLDALFTYSTDGVNWSSVYDDIISGNITVNNGGTIYFHVAPYFQGNVGTYLLDVNITRTLSLGVNENLFANNIKIYPNPTSSKVFFDNSKEYFKEVGIYNYLGQEVKRSSFKTYETNQEIDLSSLSSGVYVLKFIKENNISSLKIIKE